jgi:hypothetical protein
MILHGLGNYKVDGFQGVGGGVAARCAVFLEHYFSLGSSLSQSVSGCPGGRSTDAW